MVSVSKAMRLRSCSLRKRKKGFGELKDIEKKGKDSKEKHPYIGWVRGNSANWQLLLCRTLSR
jgi:hypothetical protein